MYRKIVIYVILFAAALLVVTQTATAEMMPQLQRFAQRDPAGYRDGLNMHLYESSNPLGEADPTAPDLVEARNPGSCPGSHLRAFSWNCAAAPPLPAEASNARIPPARPGEALPSILPRRLTPYAVASPIGCENVPPVPPGNACNVYPADYIYSGAYARCFCACTPDSDWSNCVRACLICAYERGADPDTAYQYCYSHCEGMTGEDIVWLGSCWWLCKAIW